MKSPTAYRILSWTWGLPMTLLGHIVAAILRLVGYKPQKWGGSAYFVVGSGWGGLSLGPITLTSNPSESMLNHEFGHSIQNCRWGILFPFLIAIPSALRYWYRKLIVQIGIRDERSLPSYHAIWFEAQADSLGAEYIRIWS